jgi:hypothetical protein
MRCLSVTAAVAALTAAACVHDPPARARSPRETVVLDAVTFECPGEPGWRATDVSAPGLPEVSTVALAGPVAGGFRRVALVREWARTPRAISREEFLEQVRGSFVAEDPSWIATPTPAQAIVAEERFGPLSARGALRLDPASERGDDGEPARVVHVLQFVPPSRPDRLVRAVWLEPAGAGQNASGAEERAEGFFTSLRERPGAAPRYQATALVGMRLHERAR